MRFRKPEKQAYQGFIRPTCIKANEWLMNWYDNLASFIFSHPPNDNVSLVRVVLDQSGDGIIEVIYKYGNDKSKPSFRFEQ